MSRAPIVLLTNDDGCDAVGLEAMRTSLVQLGAHVLVVAPAKNHSAGSHRVTMSAPLRLTRVGFGDVYTCTGTPADCVRVGLLSGLLPVPDVVVSGINHGTNAGEDIHYSGTVAAAAEAAMLGLPAIAVSQNGDGPRLRFLVPHPTAFPDADLGARLAVWVANNRLPDGLLLNLNLATKSNAESIELASLGRRTWDDASVGAVEVADGVWDLDPWAKLPDPLFTPGTDFDGLRNGRVTLGVLSVRGGLHDALDEQRTWVAALPL